MMGSKTHSPNLNRKAADMPDDRRTMAGIAELLGVKAATIRHYRAVSAPGGRYADHPFPEPDGHLSNVPYWLVTSDDKIRAWAAGRPGKGKGGGKPAHRTQETETDS